MNAFLISSALQQSHFVIPLTHIRNISEMSIFVIYLVNDLLIIRPIWVLIYELSVYDIRWYSLYNCSKRPMCRGSSSPNILWGGALPHQPLHHRVYFLRSPKPKKYELHIGLHLKSTISRVAKSVMG